MQQVPEEVLVPVVAQRGVGCAPGLAVEPAGAAARRGDLLESCSKTSSLPSVSELLF